MKKTLLSIIAILILFPAITYAAFTWSQGGSNSTGPYASSTVIISDGSKFVGYATSSLGFGAGSGTVGSGVIGQVPYYAANGTTLTATSSLFIDTVGRIGIGTTTPTTALHLFNASASEVLKIQSLNAAGTAAQVQLANDVGNIGQFSSLGSTASGANLALIPSSFNVTALSTGGLVIGASNASGGIRFFSGGATLASERMTLTSGGNFGVGSTTPWKKLSVTGDFVLTGGFYDSLSSAGSNGMVLQSTGSATKWVATSSLGFAVTGAGTAGQLPYYAANGTTLSATSSLFLATSGNVGIGTTTPFAKLSVIDNNSGYGIYAAGYWGVTGSSTGAGGRGVYGVANNGAAGVFGEDTSGGYGVYGTSASAIGIYGTTGGNTSPTVSAGVYATAIGTLNAALSVQQISTGYAVYALGGKNYFQNNTGIGSTTPFAKLSVKGVGTGTGINFQTTNSSDSPLFTIFDNGNIGIGTTNPVAKLEVNGTTLSDGDIFTYQNGGIFFRGNGDYNGAGVYGRTVGSDLVFQSGGLERGRFLGTGGNFGIGTTTPPSKLTVKGDIGTDGAIPALTGAGTGSAITVGSTDTGGEITEGTLSTGAIITFATAKARAPFCTVTSQSGLQFAYTISSSAITITNIGALSSTKLNYFCVNNDL